jgi:hypothetical protein
MAVTLRNIFGARLPSWLADRFPEEPSIGFRVLWSCVALLDGAIQNVFDATLMAVGKGHPSALKYLEDARGIVRGRLDTDATYAAKLPTWIDRWKEAGKQRRIAIELAEYLGESRVRVINRAGHWVTVDPDGTVTETDAAWDWDSVSHPERAGNWSELWVVVYSPTAWVERAGTLGDLTGADGYAIGHMVTMQEVDAVKLVLQRWKAAHSLIRTVLFTTDPTLYDPDVPASCPNGNWGAWSINVAGSQLLSDRDWVTTRYWEPR